MQRPSRRFIRLLLPLLATCAGAAGFAPAASAGSVYKCTGADGKVAYRDIPCDDAAQSETQVRSGNKPAVAPVQHAAPAPRDAKAEWKPATGRQADCSNWAPPPQKLLVAPAQVPANAAGQRDAMSVANACSAMVSACSNGSDDPASVDACFKSAPRCATAKPWQEAKACCPESCWQEYSELRRQCVDSLSASRRVLYDEMCVPGSVDLRQGLQVH